MAKLTGKVAVVTGASKGIGAGIAKALGAAGASVVVNYATDKAGADRVVAEITGQGGKAVAVGASVAKSAEIDTLFAETKKAFGKVDILINNAGVYGFSPVDQITEEDINRQFGINVTGLLLATQAAVALFPAEGGNIVNIGSVISETTLPQSAIYSGTKGAVDAITRVFAKELGSRNIRVNAINPGLIATEGNAGFRGPESPFEQAELAKTPLGRIGMPDDIADVVTFIVSEDARWVTGSLLQVAGGSR